MSLQTPFPSVIPDDTRRVGEVILKDNDVCRFLGQHIEAVISPDDMDWLYAEIGRPGVHPLPLPSILNA
jgi:hypothetical protein